MNSRDQPMSSTTTSSLVDERESWLQIRREKDRACRRVRTAEQREERLSKRRTRDRARCAAETDEQ